MLPRSWIARPAGASLFNDRCVRLPLNSPHLAAPCPKQCPCGCNDRCRSHSHRDIECDLYRLHESASVRYLAARRSTAVEESCLRSSRVARRRSNPPTKRRIELAGPAELTTICFQALCQLRPSEEDTVHVPFTPP